MRVQLIVFANSEINLANNATLAASNIAIYTVSL